MTVGGSNREREFHQQGGPKELLEGRQVQGLIEMPAETGRRLDCGYHKRVHGALMIDA